MKLTRSRRSDDRMRVAINLLTDHPDSPSGAHWFWTRIIPEMAKMMTEDEELHLITSPRSRPLHEGYGPNVHYITYPWSNERPMPRTLSEHLYSPLRLPLAGINVLNTPVAPLVTTAPVVAHIKTMHAYTNAASIRPAARIYRRMSYPRTARVADAIIINSESLRADILRYLEVDPAKLVMVREAVDHEMFRPGDREEASRLLAERHGLTDPFVLFVSSLWPYKNCAGLLRAYAAARTELRPRKLAIVGHGRDVQHVAELRALAAELGITEDVRWIGGVPLAETVDFYRAADVLAYPSFDETFGLPILEAMATGCPVVTSNVTAMPETAGGAAELADPRDPESIAAALVRACGREGPLMRARGIAHAGTFNWTTTAEQTLAVYRQVYAARRGR